MMMMILVWIKLKPLCILKLLLFDIDIYNFTKDFKIDIIIKYE